MLSGPRLLALVASGSYPSPAADGRLWKYCGSALPSLSVNDWPISLLPTGFPSTSMIEPFGVVTQARDLRHQPDEQRVGQADDDGEHQ